VEGWARAALCAAVVLLSAGPAPAAADDGQAYWVEQLGLPAAWGISTGSGVTVGVLDTGVNADHPDLLGAVLPGREFPDLGTGTGDARGHGTEMAVLIAGRGRDGGGATGVAPGAEVLPVKVSGNSEDVNAAIIWAVDQGAEVLNLSLGGLSGGRPERYDKGLRYAEGHDVVVVAAAGNVGADRGVATPANRPGVVAVSAVDRSGTFRSDISVEGPEIVLAAPGADITTLQDHEKTRATRTSRGTSEAAALVTGTAALVRSRFPALTAANVVERLTRSADDGGTAGRDPQYGFGVVNPLRALTEDVSAVTASPLGGLGVPPSGAPGEHRAAGAQPRLLLWLLPLVGAVLVAAWVRHRIVRGCRPRRR
jgi:serine protease